MTYQPELYDVVTAPTMQNDVEWYCRQARQSGGPVLERLRSKLGAASPDVQARTSVVSGDMRTFDLAERFALIICPFRTFLHNVTEADQLACLARVRHHLRPSGRFAFNVFHPSLTFVSQHAGPLAGAWRWSGNHGLPSGGWVVQSEAIRYDTVGQAVHALHRYDVFGATGTLERTSMLRLQLAYLYPSEIRRLLETAGFTNITISGGFDGGEFGHEGQELVVEAQRDV